MGRIEHASADGPNNFKMMLMEEPCIRDLHEITRIEDVDEPVDDSEEREKQLLLDEIKGLKRSLESIRESTIQECKQNKMERLAEKDARIQELKEDTKRLEVFF